MAKHISATFQRLIGVARECAKAAVGVMMLSTSAIAAEKVDLALVLALDASASVDASEYALQLGGIASALRDRDVQAAIARGPNGRIAVNMLIWARPSDNKQKTGWRIIATAEDADRFAAEIVSIPRLQGGGTAIGEGIAAALFEIRICDYESTRRVIDVSGDGRESFVKLPETGDVLLLPQAHEYADKMNVIINGLAITGEDLDLYTYYLEKVRHGPGSFALPALTYTDFARAMKLKLLREIAAEPIALR